MSEAPVALAPGARVVIRDEEWLVRRVDRSSDGGHLLTCDGVSDLVRARTALFLTELEGPIDILDPAATALVADPSPTFNASLLYVESQRRRCTPNDERIRVGHRAVMDLIPFQLDPALQALRQPRTRILIADSVGLGKTLEAGVLATELIQRGRGKRILVVTQKSMLTQFQKEWWTRFTIPLVRLDSTGLARVRNRIPANHNPFNHFDRSIISVDTLKSNLEYRNYLENAWWDMIVIDECHNVAARAAETGMSRRARLARLLATRSDTLILLSATPHDGSARSFASLMSLLDPTAISDPDDYTPADYRDKGLVIRRFKKDVRDQIADEFPERVTTCLREAASAAEEAAFRALLDVPFTQGGVHRAGRQQELQRVGMQKAVFSSPAAARESTAARIALLGKPAATADERREVEALRAFDAALAAIDTPAFSRYRRLLAHLRDPAFGWQPDDPADRLVVFSERIETLRWLARQLAADLGFPAERIEVLHGQLADTEQQKLVERFGRRDDPVRILLCSDVASEGLNLHHFCHRLVHFDLPWSLMVFQQRNGRVDRYGQKHRPEIVYLLTQSGVDRIGGDLRILDVLQRKDEFANRNLGDPASFLHVYDPDREAAKLGDFMAEGASPEAVDAAFDAELAAEHPGDGDWLAELFGGGSQGPASGSEGRAPLPDSRDGIEASRSLFASDFAFAKTALMQLSSPTPFVQWQADDGAQTIALTAPADLRQRLLQLPREVQRDDDHYVLCADAGRVAAEIESARQARAEDDTWPRLHYLWSQHPVLDWLADRVQTAFGRHRAPVIASPRLSDGEQAFLMMGLVPNRKGQPLLVDWQAACRTGNGDFALEPFDAFVQRAGLAAGALPNPGRALPLDALQRALPAAVAAMRAHMVARQDAFAADLRGRLAGTLADLERLQKAQIEQLERRIERSALTASIARARFDRRSRTIHKVFDDYRQWVEDTLTTEPQPYLQVAAAVCR